MDVVITVEEPTDKLGGMNSYIRLLERTPRLPSLIFVSYFSITFFLFNSFHDV